MFTRGRSPSGDRLEREILGGGTLWRSCWADSSQASLGKPFEVRSDQMSPMAVGQNCFGSQFGVGEFTTHFRTYFSGWIGMTGGTGF